MIVVTLAEQEEGEAISFRVHAPEQGQAVDITDQYEAHQMMVEQDGRYISGILIGQDVTSKVEVQPDGSVGMKSEVPS